MIDPIEVTGLKDALRAIRKVEPGLKKQFMQDARMILEPAVVEIRKAYPAQLTSGTARNWKPNKYNLFPYDQKRARRGVKIIVSTGTKYSNSVIRIVQKDPSAVVAEFAGSRNPNPLAQVLSFKYGRPGRFAWPAIERKKEEVAENMKKATLNLIARVNRSLR